MTSLEMKTISSKTHTVHYIILWFGVAISIAELMTGALLAPLGLQQGILAILLGHAIGAVILYLIGIIGVEMKKSTATITRLSFGRYGSYIFSVTNIIQLIGWTAVMIIIGAESLNKISLELIGYQNYILYCVLIGGLISIWVMFNITQLLIINSFIIILLLISSLIVAYIVFNKSSDTMSNFTQDSLSFGSAVELNVAMSLSWLPLIADYTRKLTYKLNLSVFSCVLGYALGGSLMFIIGLGAALLVKNIDITDILLSIGFCIITLFIVVFSTVMTAFIDVYSAGICAKNLNSNFNEKFASIIISLISLLLAIIIPMEQYEIFLYFIGSVFAPLFAILITDYFLLNKNKNIKSDLLNFKNLALWIIGFALYRFLLPYSTVIGITLLCVLAYKILPTKYFRHSSK